MNERKHRKLRRDTKFHKDVKKRMTERHQTNKNNKRKAYNLLIQRAI
jgi:hypothetical protein